MDTETPTRVKSRQNTENSYQEYPYQQISSTQIEEEGFQWFMRNGLPTDLEDGVYLYNLDGKEGSGTHWSCFALRYPSIFYYDPFGTDLNGYPPEELRQFGKRNGFKVIYASEHDNQHLKSYLCGYYSLFIARLLKSHLGSLTETQFDHLLDTSFDHHPTSNNVQKITKWSKAEGLL